MKMIAVQSCCANLSNQWQKLTDPPTEEQVASVADWADGQAKKHESPYCIQLTAKDKQKIMMLQAFKRIVLGKKVRIKAPNCLEEWEKQLAEEDKQTKDTLVEARPCVCGGCQASLKIDLLA